MINLIMLMTAKGDLLISRVYREDIKGAADIFRTHIIAAKEVRAPLKTVGSSTFLHILSGKFTSNLPFLSNITSPGSIYVVAVTRHNANVSAVFEVLHKLVEIFKSYFNDVFDEESIKNNFVLIYELLDGNNILNNLSD